MITAWLRIALSIHLVQAAYDISFARDDDLTRFVSRPEIRVPRLNVKIFDEPAALPGFWFLGPYVNITQQLHPFNVYQACQIGPAIYDNYGELVWAGACDVRNHNVVDFRPIKINGSDHLSFIMSGPFMEDTKGHGVILNSSYDLIEEIDARVGTGIFNMHELRFDDSKNRFSAIHIGTRLVQKDLRDVEFSPHREGWIADTGIREVELSTGETLFEWWPSDNINAAESDYNYNMHHLNSPMAAWNWFHANSVEKNDDGDYMLSARYTSTIYKISGKDGKILWRLGGRMSDFYLDGFNFSYQHDARWLSCNDQEEIISFLDNGADSMMKKNTTQTSSALIVALNKRATPPTARILRRWYRPDGELSRLRGNFQTFPNSTNVVIGWSDDAYITEHNEAGRLLVEARFQSNRMVTYRSYKANFTGTPNEHPDIVAYAFGTSIEKSTTVVYVSWNGATEVAAWNFYSAPLGDEPGFLGTTPRAGFETTFQVESYYQTVFAEAIDGNGQPLPYGQSAIVMVKSTVSPSQDGGAYVNADPPAASTPADKSYVEMLGSTHEGLRREDAVVKDEL